MIKKVDTFKSGPFVFSLNYNREQLISQFAKAKVLYTTIAQIPILPDLASNLEEGLIRKSIFGTAAIEGNPLTEEKVNKVLSQEEIKGKMEHAEKQIRNLKDAYKIIKNTKVSSAPMLLEETLIKELHKIITKDCEGPDNSPGRYRNYVVKVGNEQHGGIYTPPKIFEDIQNLMKHFIDWINSKEILEEDAAIRGALAHYHFALIHPFGNGNGRTARAIEAILLKSVGIKFVPHMLSNFYYRNIDDYFWVFSRSERNDAYDITPFIEFFLKGLVVSLEEIQSSIFFWIRKFTLRDYYIYLRRAKKITQRQFDLLTLLLESREEFTLKDLFEKEKFRIIYRKVSERTARRDLKLLESDRIIQVNQKGNFFLNDRAIG
jgi:Fic family protein